MSVFRQNNDQLSTQNTSTAQLAPGGSFTGVSVLVRNAPDVFVDIRCTNTNLDYYVEFSNDNVVFTSIPYKFSSGSINPSHKLTKAPRYCRIRVVNNSALTTTGFSVYTYFGTFGPTTTSIGNILPKTFDAIAVKPTDLESEITLEKREGYRNFSRHGSNPNLGTTPSLLSHVSTVSLSKPAAPGVVTLTSSSALNDTTLGTGARLWSIIGLDSNGIYQTEDNIPMVSGVATSTKVFSAVNRVFITKVLGGAGSSQTNAGNITCTIGVTTVAYVPIGYSITQQLICFVPSDSKSLLKGIYVQASKLSGGGTPTVTFTGYKVLNGVREHFFEIVHDTAVETKTFIPFPDRLLLENNSTLYVFASASTSGVFARARLFQEIIED